MPRVNRAISPRVPESTTEESPPTEGASPATESDESSFDKSRGSKPVELQVKNAEETAGRDAAPQEPKPPRTLNPESVKRAEKDFERMQKNPRPEGKAEFVSQMLKHNAKDPDYQAALMKKVLPHLPAMAVKATGEQNEAFGQGIRHAREAGAVTDDELRAQALKTPGMRNAIAAAGVPGVDSDANVQVSVNKVRDATSQYDAIRKKVDQKNEQLARITANPALKDDQKTRIAEKFRAEHKALYEEERAKAKELAEAFKANRSQLEQAAASGDAAPLKKALERLSGSSEAQFALDEVSRIATENGGAAKALGDEFIEETSEAAIRGTMSEQLIRTGGDPEKSFAGVMKTLSKYYDDIRTPSKLNKAAASVHKAYELIKKGDHRGSGLTEAVKEKWNKLKAAGPAGRGLAAADIASKLIKAGTSDEARKIAQYLGSASKDTAELVAGAMAIKGQVGRAGQFAVGALKRVAPVLGLVANALSGYDNFLKWKQTDNLGYMGKMAGDVLSGAGGIATLAGFGPWGLGLAGVGAIVSSVSGYLTKQNEAEADVKAASKFLEQEGFSADEARAILKNGRHLGALADKGMTQDQILALVRNEKTRQMLNDGESLVPELFERLKKYGATPQQAFDVLQAADSERLKKLVKHLDWLALNAPHRDPQAMREWVVKNLPARQDPEIAELLRRIQASPPRLSPPVSMRR